MWASLDQPLFASSASGHLGTARDLSGQVWGVVCGRGGSVGGGGGVTWVRRAGVVACVRRERRVPHAMGNGRGDSRVPVIGGDFWCDGVMWHGIAWKGMVIKTHITPKSVHVLFF